MSDLGCMKCLQRLTLPGGGFGGRFLQHGHFERSGVQSI
jgi:hypothetical protein